MATGEQTAGSFFLSEAVIQPGFAGPPPHLHERLHDMFYVLEGTLTLRLGAFVGVPPGVIHTFSNRSEEPVRFLNFNTPAGWVQYMRDLAAGLVSGNPTPEEIERIASRYDFHIA